MKSCSCVVKGHSGGLFSNINKVVTCLRIYDHVHVDWGPDFIYGDCWNLLFNPTAPPGGSFDTVVKYPFLDMTAACAGVLYENPSWEWREQFHELWRKLKVRSDVRQEAESFGGAGNFCSVMIRNDLHSGEQLSRRSQTLDEYASAIPKDSQVFVMCGDKETLAWLSARFQCFIYPGGNRVERRSDPEAYQVFKQTPADARQVFVEVLIASMGKALIHPVSNMATAALYINPAMQSIYLR